MLPADEVQVAELGVPYIMMHMRGDPSTMQSAENTAYEDVCADVGRELQITAAAAMRSGIEPWRIIPDPGKTTRVSHDRRMCRLVCKLRCCPSQGVCS